MPSMNINLPVAEKKDEHRKLSPHISYTCIYSIILFLPIHRIRGKMYASIFISGNVTILEDNGIQVVVKSCSLQ